MTAQEIIDAVIAGVLATPDNKLATDASGRVSVNFSQTGMVPRALDAVADADLTVGDAYVAAISGAAGKEDKSGTAYTVKTPSTGTTIRTFTLDDADSPTSRS